MVSVEVIRNGFIVKIIVRYRNNMVIWLDIESLMLLFVRSKKSNGGLIMLKFDKILILFGNLF